MTAHVLDSRAATVLRTGPHPFDVFFAPESVAVFGATEAPSSPGRALMSNLIHNPFGGVVLPVSERRSSVLGVKAYPSLAAVPVPVDLALIATPAPTVPAILRECLAAGVRGAVVLSAGFGDSGPAGTELEQQVRRCLRHGSMRVLGPNSLGLACPRTRLNATFAPAMVPPGKVGFLSQSGALLTALLSGEHAERLGASAFISVGSLLDISWAEWLNYLAADPHTECLGLYVEQLDNPRSFLAAVREVAPRKPVILIKGGGEESVAPRWDEVFDEACRCSGVLRVQRLADLFRMADVLSARPAATGRRLAILTNARGPALLAADALHAGGGRLAPLAEETVAALAGVLTARWNRRNPIDAGDDTDAARFTRAAALAVRDPNTDGLLVLLAPGATIDPVRAAEGVRDVARACGKPVLACWMWGAAGPESLARLHEAGIPTFHSPEAAVRTFGYLWRHAENVCFLGERGAARAAAEGAPLDAGGAAGLLAKARRAGRVTLREAEARELLAAYGLPVQQTRRARGEAEAAGAADALGYPVLLELPAGLVPPGGGEELRLKAADAAAARRVVRTLDLIAREHFGAKAPVRVTIRTPVPPGAVELAVTITSHPELGPVLHLGESGGPAGGPRQGARALVPLTSRSAREMIEQVPVLAAPVRSGGVPLALDDLGQFLLRLSALVAEQPEIREITINSLLVSAQEVIARDPRVLLFAAQTEPGPLRGPAPAS
jgi:acetyltransferase